MELKQNDFEHIKDQRQKGLITLDQAHVLMVKARRVLLVGRLPMDVRKALNAAVKRGELGHMGKSGNEPEAYFHPTFGHLARSERRQQAQSALRALAGVIARPMEDTGAVDKESLTAQELAIEGESK